MALCSAGFRLADVAVDFVKDIPPEIDPNIVSSVAIATENDIPQLRELASKTFLFSRFDDPVFGPEASTKIYGEWVTKAVLGNFDDVCLVVKGEDEIVGFVTCKKESASDCRIGLISVAKEYRGKGVTRLLLGAAEEYALSSGKKLMRVNTQSKNTNAMRLYESYGFKIFEKNVWLYYGSDS